MRSCRNITHVSINMSMKYLLNFLWWDWMFAYNGFSCFRVFRFNVQNEIQNAVSNRV